jgi:hypothetical protein
MKKIIALSGIILAAILLNSCKKKYDTPPLKSVNDGAQISANEMKARVPSNSSFYRFGIGDTNFYAIVTADEMSGNLYKTVYVRDDNNGAIQLNLTSTGGLRTGDKIRINMNNLMVINVNSMIAIDSVDIGKSLVKISSGNPVTPLEVTIAQIQAGAVPTNTNSLQSQVVILKEVEFTEKNKTFADAIGKASVNRALKQCNSSSTVTVRTSGYANFASKLTPAGNGTLIAVVTQYNNTMQLTIRDYAEINMPNTGCPVPPPAPGTYLSKDFTDNSVTSGGWSIANVIGSINWTTASTTSVTASPFAIINNYISAGNQPACETWLISPAVDLSASSAPSFSFSSAVFFSGPAAQVLVSTDYTSGSPSTASWTALSATFASSDNFTPSGNISFSAYKTANVRVAFKYTGSANSGLRLKIDNIRIGE